MHKLKICLSTLCLAACGGAGLEEAVDHTEDPIFNVVLALPPNVDVNFEPMGGPEDPANSLVYEVLAKKRNTDPLQALLNAEALIKNQTSSPIHLTKAEVQFSGGGPATVVWNESTLLDPDSKDRTMLSNGGWNRVGYQVEPPDSGVWERWDDVAVRNSPSRRFYAAGTRYDGKKRFMVGRYNATGAIDMTATAFNGWSNGAAKAIAYHSDVVIAAGGVSGNAAYFAMARFDKNLELDTSFSGDGQAHFGLPGCGEEELVDVVPVSHGGQMRYVAVGRAKCNGQWKTGVVRLNENGSLDTSFDGDGRKTLNFFGWDTQPGGIAVKSIGGQKRIFVAGKMGNDCNPGVTAPGTCRMFAVRLDWDGDFDMSFGSIGAWRVIEPEAGENMGGEAIAIDAANRIVIGGWTERLSGNQRLLTIVRLTAGGSLDPNLSGGGGGELGCVGCGGVVKVKPNGYSAVGEDVMVLEDGRIAATGWVHTPIGGRDFALIAFNTNGSVDFQRNAFFGKPGSARYHFPTALTEDSLNRILMVGWSFDLVNGLPTPVRRATAMFLTDGKIAKKTNIPAGQSRRLFFDLPYFEAPFPDSLTLRLHFEGYVVHSSSVDLAKHLNGPDASYKFPADVSDLPDDTYWTIGKAHEMGFHNHRWSRSQRYAYDFGMVRYTGSGWSHVKEGMDGSENDHYVVWNKPIYALDDGDILTCYRTKNENPAPGERDESVTGGGNMFWIRHDSGETVLYAHFKDNSVPFGRCPIEGDQSEPYPRVQKGQMLGRVGNTGSSSGPHLHIHVQRTKADGDGLPLHFHEMKVQERQWPLGSWVVSNGKATTNGPMLIEPFTGEASIGCDGQGKIDGGEWAGELCGTVAGNPCADIDAGYYSNEWLYGVNDVSDPRWHPNGDFSYHHRCDFDINTGAEMSCVANGKGDPVCKICGTGKGDNYTQIGCRPARGCPSGTDLWPDGRCWSSDTELPNWMCEADCESMYNGHGYCMNGLNWRMMAQDMSPILSSYPWQNAQYNYAAPMCASWDCDGFGAGCANQGKSCAPDSGQCEIECISSADCQAVEPPPAYPNGFVCEDTLTCVLHFTAKP